MRTNSAINRALSAGGFHPMTLNSTYRQYRCDTIRAIR